MGERLLTLRELNRATLARQLLLERKQLSPAAVIERLVGMQAQWPSAPYVGIWTRTTSFGRETLERALAQQHVVKATVMRQTLHLVTRRDYTLLRAALSETNFPWETAPAKHLAPSVRRLAAGRPVTTAEALAHLEREHGLTGLDARRAWRAARVSGSSPGRGRRRRACRGRAVHDAPEISRPSRARGGRAPRGIPRRLTRGDRPRSGQLRRIAAR